MLAMVYTAVVSGGLEGQDLGQCRVCRATAFAPRPAPSPHILPDGKGGETWRTVGSDSGSGKGAARSGSDRCSPFGFNL